MTPYGFRDEFLALKQVVEDYFPRVVVVGNPPPNTGQFKQLNKRMPTHCRTMDLNLPFRNMLVDVTTSKISQYPRVGAFEVTAELSDPKYAASTAKTRVGNGDGTVGHGSEYKNVVPAATDLPRRMIFSKIQDKCFPDPEAVVLQTLRFLTWVLDSDAEEHMLKDLRALGHDLTMPDAYTREWDVRFVGVVLQMLLLLLLLLHTLRMCSIQM